MMMIRFNQIVVIFVILLVGNDLNESSFVYGATIRSEQQQLVTEEKTPLEKNLDIANDFLKGIKGQKVDWKSVIRSGVLAGLATIPVYGTILSTIVSMFWPAGGESVWDQVEPMVEKLVEVDIEKSIIFHVKAQVSQVHILFAEFQYSYQRYLDIATDKSSTEQQIALAFSDAHTDLKAAANYLQSVLMEIQGLETLQQVPFLIMYPSLVLLQLTALKTLYIDFSGNVFALFALVPPAITTIRYNLLELTNNIMENSQCGNLKNSQLGLSNRYTRREGVWAQGCSYPDADAIYYSEELPYKLDSHDFAVHTRQFANSVVDDIQDSIPTEDEFFSIANSLLEVPFSQLQMVNDFVDGKKQCILGPTSSNNDETVHIVPCDIISSTSSGNSEFFWGMDTKGHIVPASEVGLCLTALDDPYVGFGSLILSPCLDLPAQRWKFFMQLGVFYLASEEDNQNRRYIMADGSHMVYLDYGDNDYKRDRQRFKFQYDNRVEQEPVQDCVGDIVGLSTDTFYQSDGFFTFGAISNSFKAQKMCQSLASPSECPQMSIAVTPCVVPKPVASENEYFVVKSGMGYFFGASDSQMKYTMSEIFTAEQLSNQAVDNAYDSFPSEVLIRCSLDKFGDPAPYRNKLCYEVPYCTEQPYYRKLQDVCSGDFEYPNPFVCNQDYVNAGVCTSHPRTNWLSHNSITLLAKEGNRFTIPKQATGFILFGSTETGQYVAMSAQDWIWHDYEGAKCSVDLFSNQDPAPDYDKSCYYVSALDYIKDSYHEDWFQSNTKPDNLVGVKYVG